MLGGDWVSLGLPPVIDLWGFHIEIIRGWWTGIVIPLAGILIGAGIVRLLWGREALKGFSRDDE